jgi:hypothetical protein
MALFPRWTNTVSRLSALTAVVVPCAAIAAALLIARSPYITNQNVEHDQPVQFDHSHHAGDLAINCQYCHVSVLKSPNATIPSVSLCMGCHAQVWTNTGRLEPVKAAYQENKPILWNKVHILPDFVYFNHSAHTNKGVGCVSCHGRMDQMAAARQASPLTMQWCLECHRNPAPNLRPIEELTNMKWTPPADAAEAQKLGADLVAKYNVHPRVTCEVCHR